MYLTFLYLLYQWSDSDDISKNDMCISFATSAAAIHKSPLHFRPLPLCLHTPEGLYFWDDSHWWTVCLVCCLWCYAVPPQQGESSGVEAHRQVRPCWHLSFNVQYVWQFTLRCRASRLLLGWRGGSKWLGYTGLQTDFFFFFQTHTLNRVLWAFLMSKLPNSTCYRCFCQILMYFNVALPILVAYDAKHVT